MSDPSILDFQSLIWEAPVEPDALGAVSFQLAVSDSVLAVELGPFSWPGEYDQAAWEDKDKCFPYSPAECYIIAKNISTIRKELYLFQCQIDSSINISDTEKKGANSVRYLSAYQSCDRIAKNMSEIKKTYDLVERRLLLSTDKAHLVDYVERDKPAFEKIEGMAISLEEIGRRYLIPNELRFSVKDREKLQKKCNEISDLIKKLKFSRSNEFIEMEHSIAAHLIGILAMLENEFDEYVILPRMQLERCHNLMKEARSNTNKNANYFSRLEKVISFTDKILSNATKIEKLIT